MKPFEATGILPLNPDMKLNCFANEQQSQENSTSVISGKNWHKIERLVRSVDPSTAKLTIFNDGHFADSRNLSLQL